MSTVHQKCEKWFANVTALICRWRYLTLVVMVVITALMASQLPKLTIDTRDEAFFHDDDPALLAYNEFRDMFGQDDLFIIAIKPKGGLTRPFFQTLRKLHNELEASVPYLDEITSLINARIVRAEQDTLMVEGLLDQPPQNEADLNGILAMVERYPLYENLLISKDRTMVSILIKAQTTVAMSDEAAMAQFDQSTPSDEDQPTVYLSNDQYVKIDATIKKIIDTYRDGSMDFYLSGTPAFVAEIQQGIQKDLAKMAPLSFGVIILFLALLFRRFSGVVYPLITVALSLISSLGLMASLGIAITNAIGILPTFLIVVGIGDSVHILTIFYRIHGRINDKRQAIVQAVGFAGLPVLMTSVTTACGLLSLALADVAIIAQLGYIASAGVMLAFIYTVVLLPALIAIFPTKAIAVDDKNHSLRVDRIFSAIARTTTHHPLRVIMISVVILAAAVYGALNVRFSHNALTWLPEESAIRQATDLIDRVNGGTVTMDVVVDTGTPNGLYEPDLVQRLDAAAAYLPEINANGIQAGKVWSVADMLKEINRALNEDKDSAYQVPDTRELVAQELLLFESSGSDDLETLVDSTYQMARLSLVTPFRDAIFYKAYVDQVRAYLHQQFPTEKVAVTGHITIFIEIIERFITSMAKSYGLALVVITLLMLLIIGRIGVGLMSMAANVAPVVCIFGLMGAFNVPLDMATIIIGSLVLGIVVDDTIHFLHHFRKAYEQTNDVEAAVRETLYTTGRALVITSLVLSGGFFIYTASFLASNIRFGWLTACAVYFALAADFFLVPALLSLVYGKKAGAGVSTPAEELTATVATEN